MGIFSRRRNDDDERTTATTTDDRGAYATTADGDTADAPARDDRARTTDDRGDYSTTEGDRGAYDGRRGDRDGYEATRDDRRDYANTEDGRGDHATPRDGRGDYATTTSDRGAYATTAGPDARARRTWHHGPVRALMTLLAVAVAGLLAWLTTTMSDNSTGGYWAIYGILAAAGLVMALSQVLGGWTKWGSLRFSPTVFLLAFVPTLIAVGWILLFHQPHATLWRGNITNWSGDIGIRGLVEDMGGPLLTMLSFGLGLVFGFCFDTTGTRAPAAPVARRTVAPAPADRDADEPLARDRVRDRDTVVRS